jgi:hypothetical protein
MHLLAITIAFTGVLAAQVPFDQVGRVKTNDRILNIEVRSKIGKIVEEHTASGYSVGVQQWRKSLDNGGRELKRETL